VKNGVDEYALILRFVENLEGKAPDEGSAEFINSNGIKFGVPPHS